MCEVDLLRDQTFLFTIRLKKLGNDTKLYVMKDYIHSSNS